MGEGEMNLEKKWWKKMKFVGERKRFAKKEDFE